MKTWVITLLVLTALVIGGIICLYFIYANV